MSSISNLRAGLVRCLGLGAVAALVLLGAPTRQAEALTLVNPAAVPAAKSTTEGMITQVRGGGFHGGGGFRGGGFRGGGAHFGGGGFRGGHVGGFRGGGRYYGGRHFYGGRRFYGYGGYYGHRCRIILTYYGPRRVCGWRYGYPYYW